MPIILPDALPAAAQLRAEARVIKRSRTLGYVECDVVDEDVDVEVLDGQHRAAVPELRISRHRWGSLQGGAPCQVVVFRRMCWVWCVCS